MNKIKKNIEVSFHERVIDSRDLFGQDKVIIIRHEEQYYRLMITRQGKLILNK